MSIREAAWELSNMPDMLRDVGRRVLEHIEAWTPESTFTAELLEARLSNLSDDNAIAGVGVDPWDKRRRELVEIVNWRSER